MGRQFQRLFASAICAAFTVAVSSSAFAQQKSDDPSAKISNIFDQALNDGATRQEALRKVFMETALQDAAANACTVLPPDQSYVEEMLVRFSDDGAKSFERRVALVVGNSAYENGIGVLENPSNDANSMARVLRALGFTVHVGLDLDADTLDQCLSGYEQDLANAHADIALFFYAGHGVQLVSEADNEKRNYMLATDAAVSSAGEGVGFKQIDAVLTDMRAHSEQSVFFYDACRNDPLGASKPTIIDGQAIERAAVSLGGAAAIDVDEATAEDSAGIYIAYATAPNRVADDAYEAGADHSPFTRALLNHIATPGASLQQVMAFASNDVGELTEWNQTPWTSSSLTEDLRLNGAMAQREIDTLRGERTARVDAALADGRKSDAIIAALGASPSTWPEESKGEAVDAAKAALFRAMREGEFNLDHDPGQELLGFITTADISPDGNVIAAGDAKGMVGLWSAHTGGLIQTVDEFDAPISSVGFSPDGARLVVSLWQRDAHIFDLASNTKIVTLSGHGSDSSGFEIVTSASYSPDGNTVLTSSVDDTARIWNAQTGLLMVELRGHTDDVTDAVYSPEGRLIATTSEDATVRLWRAADGRPAGRLSGHSGPVIAAVFSPDGNRLATAGENGAVKLWDVRTRSLLRTITAGVGRLFHVAYSPDGALLASTSSSNDVKFWDAETGASAGSLTGYEEAVVNTLFLPDRRRILTMSRDRTSRVRFIHGEEALRSFDDHRRDVRDVGFRPQGGLAYTVSTGDGAYIRSLQNSDGKTLFKATRGPSMSRGLMAAAISPNGEYFAAGGLFGHVFLWPNNSTTPLNIWKISDQQVEDLSFSSDGAVLAVAANGGVAQIISMASGPRTRFNVASQFVRSISLSPDGGRALVVTDDGASLFDAQTGALFEIAIDGHDARITSGVFSPDGGQLLTGSWDRTAKLWNAQTGDLVRTFSGPSDWVNNVAFSPDGRLVAAAGNDDSIMIWDARNGQRLTTLEGHADDVLAIAFSPGGNQLLSGSKDKTAKLWEVGEYGPDLLTRAYDLLSPEMRGQVERQRIRYWEVDAALLQ